MGKIKVVPLHRNSKHYVSNTVCLYCRYRGFDWRKLSHSTTIDARNTQTLQSIQKAKAYNGSSEEFFDRKQKSII